jgi:hypothetical protein
VNHNNKGNCWSPDAIYDCSRCGSDDACDVCHKHDEPRGECSVCPPCAKCDAEAGAPVAGGGDDEGKHKEE